MWGPAALLPGDPETAGLGLGSGVGHGVGGLGLGPGLSTEGVLKC